ncbi:hypothetical protein NQ317_005669 [Molorchus minor]|uniref:PID domain-containing protein n=1 Tax=Molorchus minor TaxID=1323400 RepID=A0ABQ9IXP9_9CUCU|nr:hypothetical protein NQ317_014667 [Molorchus minor]KAJ8986195.1 hypothetical protein NQ317_005669 [Molorchus minor]
MPFFKKWKASSKHQKLSEELALQNNKETESEANDVETENDVVTFKLKYLGSTVVEKITGDSISTEAVKNIMKTAKAKGRKKLQRVNVAISLKGIAVTDLQGNDILKISIYRISNCSTDPTHKQIFSFVSTDEDETMECHAFICSKRKTAETVTLAVAHAFSTAYEAWRVLPGTKEVQSNAMNIKTMESNMENIRNNLNIESVTGNSDGTKIEDVVEEKLIDFDDEVDKIDDDAFLFESPVCEQAVTHNRWVCFDDDFVSDFDSNNPHQPHYQVDLILA